MDVEIIIKVKVCEGPKKDLWMLFLAIFGEDLKKNRCLCGRNFDVFRRELEQSVAYVYLGDRRNRGWMAKDSWHSSKSSARMKKTQESSKWLFLDNLTTEIESKAPNYSSDITFE